MEHIHVQKKGSVEMNVKCVLLFIIIIASPCIFASEASHQNAAKELIEVVDIDTVLDAMYENMNATIAQSLVKQDPCFESIKKPLADLFTKHNQKILNAELFKKKMQEIYVETFTEPEIQEIIAFYKTPVGQKTLKTMPLVMTKSSEFAQKEMAKANNSGAATELQNNIIQLIKDIDRKQLSPECKKHFDKKIQQLNK